MENSKPILAFYLYIFCYLKMFNNIIIVNITLNKQLNNKKSICQQTNAN
jgi:hypothetical protein